MDFEQNIEKLKSALRPLARVTDVRHDNDAFCLTFARIFASETPNYDLGNGLIGATRSNWTYHTASAIGQTAKAFGYTCKFECSGKRDAVIETRDEEPEVLLFAEWEWDYLDIFGKGKELEKLRNSCRGIGTADAFLLVYCPVDSLAEYSTQILTYWQKAFSRNNTPPVLYVNTIVFSASKTTREFVNLVLIAIHSQDVWIMSSLPL